MNQKLPKPMLDALARGAKPADHPSADVLAAFVERGLGEGEQQAVTDHLTCCGECREVVFLASSAAEETVNEPQVAAAAAAAANPRWRWMPRLMWLAPVAAMVILAAGYLVRQYFFPAAQETKLASNTSQQGVVQPPRPQQEVTAMQPAPTVAIRIPAGTPRATATPAVTQPAKKVQPASPDVVAMDAAATAETPKAAAEPAAITIGGVIATAPSAPRANALAPSPGEAVQEYRAAPSLGYSLSRALQAAHPGWRVTAQGHLEHLTPAGWTRVLAEHTSAFRVVSVVGTEVWAGGDGGALFHSSEEGQHWKKVAVAADGVSETGAIVSVSFNDPQHGVVAANGGATYATSDGGASWTKQ